MSENDFAVITSIIDEEREFLNAISQEIWKDPELAFEEVHAHDILTSSFRRFGFEVEKHYILPTAFKAVYSSELGGGPTVAVFLEYDALPEIGHACGHNLIAEAGFAAAMAIKTAMEADSKLVGKVVALGAPAEESGGGKITLIEKGAFDDIDFAMMVHPERVNDVFPTFLCIKSADVEFKGTEAHAASHPWEGRNALDAAVACYNNLSLLRQQIKPACRIHVIITKGGTAPNIIPGETSLTVTIRAPIVKDLMDLESSVQACITSAAAATGCTASFNFNKEKMFANVMANSSLGALYQRFAENLGVEFISMPLNDSHQMSASTDMGNVSYVVPSIHPFFRIKSSSANHTKGFTEAAGSVAAQEPTLIAAKAMALTAVKVMRSPDDMDEIKNEFQRDVPRDNQG